MPFLLALTTGKLLAVLFLNLRDFNIGAESIPQSTQLQPM